jgi:hypothetical protein
MPRSPGSDSNLWFSFTYDFVHVVHMSTEHDYTPGSPQHTFLDSELNKAYNDPHIKWIVFGGHRPLYSSST